MLQLIAVGYTTREIALQFSLSIKTIEKHRQALMDKLKIHTIAGLTRYAVSNGLVEGKLAPWNWRSNHSQAWPLMTIPFAPDLQEDFMRILLADDHTVVRSGLKQILAEEFKKAVFGEARNAEETLDLIDQQRWDIVILDITMPGRTGLEAMREIRKSRPGLPVLVLSIHPESQFAVRVLKLGAAGYMTKESAADELVSAVKKVLSGGRYVSAALAEALATNLAIGSVKPPQELLSDREFQVLRLIASGKILSEIARELVLSVKTISTYRSRVLEKMGLKNNAELMHYAMQHQLVEINPEALGAQ